MFCVSVKVKLTVPLLCLCVHSVWKGRPRNDLHCVGWDAKPYSLTHSLLWFVSLRCEPINYPLPRSRLLVAKVTVKVKGPCPRGGLRRGDHLSYVGSWARRWICHWVRDAWPVRLPSHPRGITALWPVPNYTAWWTEAQVCEQLTQGCYLAMLTITIPTLHCYTGSQG